MSKRASEPYKEILILTLHVYSSVPLRYRCKARNFWLLSSFMALPLCAMASALGEAGMEGNSRNTGLLGVQGPRIIEEYRGFNRVLQELREGL